MEAKLTALRKILQAMDGVLVAFSGGVDSTLLLACAREVLNDRVLAVTARSPLYPSGESDGARSMAEKLGTRHRMIDSHELAVPEFCGNPPNRCYLCKKELFTRLKDLAREHGLQQVVEGSNHEDRHDFRPGMEAARELGIRSPLAEAGLTKEEVRALARSMGLSNWDKPSQACLASRIPYGETITEQRLHRIVQAEEAIRSMGIRQVRVRDHGCLARIEIDSEQIALLIDPDTRKRMVAALRRAGYQYISVDLEGYRTGAMNEVLGDEKGI